MRRIAKKIYKEEKMRTKIKKWLILMGLLAMAFALSGCFYTEQDMVINPEGKAVVSVTFWFDKTFAGDEGAMAVQGLLFAFPELQTNYTMVKGEEGGDVGYTFKAKQKVDINQNRYINFKKREDGSYSFVAEIPKSIEEESESNKKVLVVKVSLPTEIEMANSLSYRDRTVEWELRENDFTRDIVLKAFTRPPILEGEEKIKPEEEGRGRAIKGLLGEGGRIIERQVEPPYPEWAQREGKTGVVELKCWVLPSGDVRNVEVYQSSGLPRLDEHARQYLMMWKFEPIKEEKIQWGIVPFHFELPEK